MTRGQLEHQLIGVEQWQQGSSVAGENGGRKEAFGRWGRRLIYAAMKTGPRGATIGQFGHRWRAGWVGTELCAGWRMKPAPGG
jgi:hypothetical protein